MIYAKSLYKIGIKEVCNTLCCGHSGSYLYCIGMQQDRGYCKLYQSAFSEKQMVDRINETDADWIFVLDEMYQYVEAALKDTCVKNVVIIPVTNSISPLLAKLFCQKQSTKNSKKET